MCPNDNVYILIRFSNRTNKETFYKNVPLKNPKNKKKEKSLLSFKFSNVFKIAPPIDNSSGVAEKQIQSFSLNRLKRRTQTRASDSKSRDTFAEIKKNGISVNGDASRNVCNSGDVIGRGGFKRSSRASTFRGLWYAKIRQQRARTKARAVSSRVKKKREREGGGERKWKRKEKKKIRKEARIEIARATDNELSGSARFRAKIQRLNRVIKSRRRLTTTSRRLPFVRYPTQLSSVLFASCN